jgi:hypothetical protein
MAMQGLCCKLILFVQGTFPIFLAAALADHCTYIMSSGWCQVVASFAMFPVKDLQQIKSNLLHARQTNGHDWTQVATEEWKDYRLWF